MDLLVFYEMSCLFGGRGPERAKKIKPEPPKSTENEPLGLLKGPIAAPLRFMQALLPANVEQFVRKGSVFLTGWLIVFWQTVFPVI